MFKLLYIDNLKFLRSKDKFRIFNNFDLNDLCNLSLRDISNSLSKDFRTTYKLPDLKLVELQKKIIDRSGAKAVTLGSKDYPLKLKRIYDLHLLFIIRVIFQILILYLGLLLVQGKSIELWLIKLKNYHLILLRIMWR